MIRSLALVAISQCLRRHPNGKHCIITNPRTLQQLLHVRLYKTQEFEFKRKSQKPSHVGRQLDIGRELEPLLNMKAYSISEWEKFETDVIDKYKYKITADNFEGITVRTLCQNQNLELFKSFVDYIKETRGLLGIYTLLQYMLFSSRNIQRLGSDTIFSLYEELLSRVDILDTYSTSCVVQSLCVTSRWKESLKLVSDLSKICEPNAASYEAIARAAFRNNEPEIAWECFDKVNDQLFIPSCETLEVICSYCKNTLQSDAEESKRHMFKLLEYLADTNVVLSKEVSQSLAEYFKTIPDEKWENEFTNLSFESECQNCLKALKSNALTDEEHNLLLEWTKEKVLISNDVFLNSTPDELKRFYYFIEKTKPFDVIIDGLNVSYRIMQNPKAYNLMSAVKYLVEKGKKRVLVIGRKHMRKWNRECMNYIRSNAMIFFTDDASQDDPFLLLSALISGPHCLVLSNDFLRNHLFKLDNSHIAELFKKWQQSQQLYLNTITNGNLHLKPTIRHMQTVQWSEDGTTIHIPYSTDGIEKLGRDFHPNWLCINKCS